MKDSDDTKAHEITHLADISPDGGHYVGVLDDGRVVPAMSQEHAETLHPDLLESGQYEAVMRRVPSQELAAGSGPAQVATEAYRDGWERIFGKKQPAGEA